MRKCSTEGVRGVSKIDNLRTGADSVLISGNWRCIALDDSADELPTIHFFPIERIASGRAPWRSARSVHAIERNCTVLWVVDIKKSFRFQRR